MDKALSAFLERDSLLLDPKQLSSFLSTEPSFVVCVGVGVGVRGSSQGVKDISKGKGNVSDRHRNLLTELQSDWTNMHPSAQCHGLSTVS